MSFSRSATVGGGSMPPPPSAVSSRAGAGAQQGGASAGRGGGRRKFEARCNGCAAKLRQSSLFTSCRHFVCEACWQRGGGACVVCRQQCRTVQLGAPHFPAEIRERSLLPLDEASQKAANAARLQSAHMAEVVARQAQLIGRAEGMCRKLQQNLQAAEQQLRRAQEEHARAKREADAAAAAAAVQHSPLARAPSVSSGASNPFSPRGFSPPLQQRFGSVSSSLLGKTMMRE